MRRKICGDKEKAREREKGEIEFISILTYLSARGRDTERPRESRITDTIHAMVEPKRLSSGLYMILLRHEYLMVTSFWLSILVMTKYLLKNDHSPQFRLL
jgi:hypothetical protein